MLIDREHRSTARISVTVTHFHELGTKDSCSRAEIELTDTGNGRVSQGRINDLIVVHGQVYLDFDVHARQGDRYTYMPVGISFRETSGVGVREAAARHGENQAHRDPLGHAAFPLRTTVSKGDTTQLTLLDANPEPGEFEFSLIIQRSDGLLSVVDPKIHNNPVMN
ncbi:MAG: hypothetical protein ABI128_03730 [Rhodanobacter sp.]